MLKVNPNGNKDLGEVIFVSEEDSFDFEPSGNADITLMINNLYLGIDSETMLAQQDYSQFIYVIMRRQLFLLVMKY